MTELKWTTAFRYSDVDRVYDVDSANQYPLIDINTL